jgi:hypothetical protein
MRIIRKNPRDRTFSSSATCHATPTPTATRGPTSSPTRKALDCDVLFFAGDQSYDHKEHLAAWLQFGRQFGEAIGSRPPSPSRTITTSAIRTCGATAAVSTLQGNADGGYVMPVEYVNMVQRQQCGHLPDPYDPTPVKRSITVYYTSLEVGGIDFAILEDRKWKSGPAGLVE